MKRTDTNTLIEAMRILARDIQSGDGVANYAISEAADRLEELNNVLGEIRNACVDPYCIFIDLCKRIEAILKKADTR